MELMTCYFYGSLHQVNFPTGFHTRVGREGLFDVYLFFLCFYAARYSSSEISKAPPPPLFYKPLESAWCGWL
jgi:hypothetical protein